MNDLLNKISSYHLFNYLLPGCLFAVFASRITHRDFVQQNVILGLFSYYFYGLVISRVGSLLVGPLLRWTRLIKFSNYSEYVMACKSDPKIDLLLESSNMYRTLLSLLIVLGLLQEYGWAVTRFSWLGRCQGIFLVLFLLAIFLFSYRKQTVHITKRVKASQEMQ
jgi:hypothetical protein